MAGEREGITHSLYVRFGIRMMLAVAGAVLLFLVLQSVGRIALDSYFSHSGYARKENYRRLKNLQSYIRENGISIGETDRIGEWVKKQEMVSVQIYEGEVLLYDSDYPEGEELPVLSVSGNYEDYEDYHLIEFRDQTGYVYLTGYYSYQFHMYATIAEIVLCALVMIGAVMAEVHRLIRYICQLDREIQILETGNLEYEITVRGRDELASMARGLEGMRKSLREQMERREEALRLNGKLVTEVSHELRTPLTAIKVYVEVLQGNRNKDSEIVFQYLDKISAKVQELNDLADRISGQEDSEGRMVKDRLVEINGDFYYMNSSGAAVTNEWRSVPNDSPSDGEPDDGKVVTGWKYLTAANDEDTKRNGDGYWFYFKTNGKKTVDADNKTINGKKYRFNEYGAAQFDWHVATGSNATPGNAVNRYYNEEDKTWLATGWFRAVPGENVDADAYNNDEAHWFYADKKGDVVKAQIKTINGHKYGFDLNGKMLRGLYKITFEDNGSAIASAEKIENEADIPESSEEGVYVYYFGDSPKEGAMKTGEVTLEIDGEKYQYRFRKSGSHKGAGADGIEENAIYVMGRKLKADKDSRCEAVTYKGEQYLVNTSGKIMKNAKNTRDADDMYYCTDKKGIIIYKGAEKYKK
ncbi:HAMP domain-containing protein [Clostridiaceae bacterium]|nr:HAMP domain-containing protein [Clostridiaceae bacterium]